jgi:hypothetical protein
VRRGHVLSCGGRGQLLGVHRVRRRLLRRHGWQRFLHELRRRHVRDFDRCYELPGELPRWHLRHYHRRHISRRCMCLLPRGHGVGPDGWRQLQELRRWHLRRSDRLERVYGLRGRIIRNKNCGHRGSGVHCLRGGIELRCGGDELRLLRHGQVPV